jgi:DNA repair protein RecO (recombination protein O)
LEVILDHLHNPTDAGELFVRFELAVLNDLGFGLDLTECAATGTRADLAYVSPKSGRAVSRGAGEPWADKMLVLPAFLSVQENHAADFESLTAAFRLTGFFLHRHVYEPRGLEASAAREGFVQAALKALNPAARTLLRPDELSA